MTADPTLSERLRVRGQQPDEAVSHYIRRLHVERFEAAAVIDAREAAVKAAVDAEREAIAVFIETHNYSVGNERRMEPSKHAINDMHHRTIAAAIRARANGGE